MLQRGVPGGASQGAGYGSGFGMFYRLRREFFRRRFNHAIRAVFDTPPLRLRPAGPHIVSMVNGDDLPMYLLSMKAFYRRIGRGRVTAIIPAAMTQADRDTLSRHIEGIALQVIDDIPTGPCQRGGCWERLLFIADAAEHDYVIQVDSDTLPLGPDLQEIEDCVQRGVAFTLVDGIRRFATMREVSDATLKMDTDYVGVFCERKFEHFPGAETLRYVRGSAALAGFPRAAGLRARVEHFHTVMEGLAGARWREWGTEQCASNYTVSNFPEAMLLPYPRYTSFFPGGPREGVNFFHFMGSFRFEEGVFARHGRAELAALSDAGHGRAP
jgi:hypothetical protein